MNFWDGRKVFLTGHTGFKGGWLLTWLLLNKAKVRGYSDGIPTQPSLFEALKLAQSCDHAEGDVRDLSKLKASLQSFEPEIVFHLAAQPLVRESYRDPITTFATNVMGTANVLESCRGLKSIKAIVIITTDKVYEIAEGTQTPAGFKESDTLGGHDPYSTSKACAELVSKSYRLSFFESLPVVTVRAGNIIGGGDWSSDRLIPDAVRAFSSNEPLSIRNPASVRPWQHVIDPIRGYIMTAEKAAQSGLKVHALNLGPPLKQCIPVKQVIETFIQKWGADAKWQLANEEAPPKETNILTLDSSLAASTLGWKTEIGVEDSLKLTADWYKAFYQGQTSTRLRELTETQIQNWGFAK
jgi:CDP-glucose 4,6-dehydratase